MAGETELNKLLAGLQPELQEGEYVFLSLGDATVLRREDYLCEFREAEGTSIIMKKSIAEKLGLDYAFVAAWISLKVYSSLEAVGLTAIVATELAKRQISCNVVAAFYHDHLFVPVKDAAKAMEVLKRLSEPEGA